MPIVNGTYVNDSLPGAKAAQMQAFGEYSRKDMSDYSAAAYNYLMKQQEQAYNLELWKLQNEYNSPAAQMKRYQDAGLNPNLIYGQSNLASSPASASATGFRSGGIAAKQAQNTINLIGQIMNVVKSARDTYDYMKYGAQEHGWQTAKTMQEGQRLSYENLWQQWLSGRGGDSVMPEDAPRRIYWQQQFDSMVANYERVKALADMIPDQKLRQQALTTLDQERGRIMSGQNDAILNINTGNPTADAWIKAILYFAMSKF